ncbi:hypothetical protein ACFQ14_14885 [Pseudahrensia aquimaris]|uniref:Uncharacterized protein n=1 Tax=Pseudahrensia aquimaris TaxID=744461 RepID=A0ABW3FGQ7_9HYPH
MFAKMFAIVAFTFVVPTTGVPVDGVQIGEGTIFSSQTLSGQKLAGRGALDAGLDPIVTGRSVTAAQKAQWIKMRDAYRACPACAMQPFPGGEH